MTAKMIAACAALALAGCMQANAPGTTTGRATAEQVVLAGEWRVAGLDGQPIAGNEGIALSANDTEIWWEPQCALQRRPYAIEGRGFRSDASRTEPGPACRIAVPPVLESIWSAIEAGERIERTPQNGILISGGGRSLLLFSQ
ncbi:MAG: hypothetical protein DI637_13730 [Citromicrobium sp.]|nr:MAG: hypothetical protein DI637_13730 [Citromicrobium sp.]